MLLCQHVGKGRPSSHNYGDFAHHQSHYHNHVTNCLPSEKSWLVQGAKERQGHGADSTEILGDGAKQASAADYVNKNPVL